LKRGTRDLPIVWKDGQFYDGSGTYIGLGLEEAYDLGLLTQDDLRKIADQFNDYNYGRK